MKHGLPMTRSKGQHAKAFRHCPEWDGAFGGKVAFCAEGLRRGIEAVLQDLLGRENLLCCATLRRGGEGWGSAAGAASMNRTPTAASTHGVRQTRDARTAEPHTAVRKSPNDSPSLAEHMSEDNSTEFCRPRKAPAPHMRTGERKPDVETPAQSRPPRRHEPAAGLYRATSLQNQTAKVRFSLAFQHPPSS
jgi:hypothetical protein